MKNENKDENCTLCDAYDMFKTLKGLNFDDEDAFHLAAKQLIDMTIDLVYAANEEFYEDDDDDDYNLDDMSDSDFMDIYDLDEDELAAMSELEELIFDVEITSDYKQAVDDIFLIIKSYRESLGAIDNE